MNLEPGKAYYSRKLHKQVFLLQEPSIFMPWVTVRDDGQPLWLTSDEVGIEDLDYMIRGVHYEAAIGTAEYLVKLGLDKADENGL